MAFGQATNGLLGKIAGEAEDSWVWAKPKKAIPWLTIAEFLMKLFGECKPKTEASADKRLKAVAAEIHENGVVGCCDVILEKVPEKKRKKARQRLFSKLGTKDVATADRVLYSLATSALQQRAAVAAAIAEEAAEGGLDPDDDE